VQNEKHRSYIRLFLSFFFFFFAKEELMMINLEVRKTASKHFRYEGLEKYAYLMQTGRCQQSCGGCSSRGDSASLHLLTTKVVINQLALLYAQVATLVDLYNYNLTVCLCPSSLNNTQAN
jgi:hypothetical protein